MKPITVVESPLLHGELILLGPDTMKSRWPSRRQFLTIKNASHLVLTCPIGMGDRVRAAIEFLAMDPDPCPPGDEEKRLRQCLSAIKG